MSFTVTVETDPHCFIQLEAEWLELLNRAHTNTIFQTPQFLSSWWKALGVGTLQIIIIRDDAGVMQGIAPLYIEVASDAQRQLNFVGCVAVSDYLDVIVAREKSEAVYQVLVEYIATQDLFDRLYWCSLPEASPTRTYSKHYFSQTQETLQDIAPCIPLPQTWELYLSSLDRKQRHEVKRKWRRLDELEHTFEIITEETAAKEALAEFIALHTTSSAAKREFWNDSHLAFFKELVSPIAQAGWLKLFFLRIEGKRVASMLLFDYNTQYALYNSGFDPALYKEVGTGATLTAYTIKHAIEQGKTTYDFLRGGEEYKLRLGAVARNVYDITVKK
jgi:CelD/BcsL family acetyltransferase involved in cellulose biosynthesis